ncbi:flavodoxin domain-containing protein [Enterococcus wangshanyuanii]|uniref:Flavodoxin domain-containing protein n=1 Tax=Enterococcus wangshanyuanii TaxID=2005703 RepID=A0ABQ1NKN3_9ENTE|nr:flavodoxin domain-containing protein [Enterococcus wangshanyuanii]GGC79518.1 hypothetical protein GCM10011573_06480 [Enterococcus wangshanyuanii]
MGNKIIVYTTRHGASESVALRISRETNYTIVSEKEFNGSSDDAEVLFVAPIYMGAVFGLDSLVKKLNKSNKVKLTIVTIGLYDPNRESNVENIRNHVESSLADSTIVLLNLFSIRGKLDMKKLSFTQKMLIKALYNKAKKADVKNRTENEQDIIKAVEENDALYFPQLDEIIQSI